MSTAEDPITTGTVVVQPNGRTGKVALQSGLSSLVRDADDHTSAWHPTKALKVAR